MLPVPDRPSMPESYGLRDPRHEATPLSWDWVVDRMSRARSYWLATSRRGGAPHVVPVWGIWFEGGFCFFTDLASQKARNARRDPRAAVHLESGDEVVVLEGGLGPETDPGTLDRAARAYEVKYGVDVAAAGGGPVMYRLTHTKVLAWDEADFPRTATRWRFALTGAG